MSVSSWGGFGHVSEMSLTCQYLGGRADCARPRPTAPGARSVTPVLTVQGRVDLGELIIDSSGRGRHANATPSDLSAPTGLVS